MTVSQQEEEIPPNAVNVMNIVYIILASLVFVFLIVVIVVRLKWISAKKAADKAFEAEAVQKMGQKVAIDMNTA